ncbi:MAG: hypothetical protein Q7S86_02600 [bacterium]|nr:hypothetical protein [bacterium]
MTLNEVPEVVVDPEDNYKFIVVELTDVNSNKRLVVRAKARPGFKYHSDILDLLCHDVFSSGLKARCIGGGSIEINSQVKTIYIWSYSGDFGREPDRQETVRILQVAFPEFQVTAG